VKQYYGHKMSSRTRTLYVGVTATALTGVTDLVITYISDAVAEFIRDAGNHQDSTSPNHRNWRTSRRLAIIAKSPALGRQIAVLFCDSCPKLSALETLVPV
jgi:hypothetical protein